MLFFLSIFFISFFVVIIVTPLIILISKKNEIFDHPDESRKFHNFPTPTLGGVGIFFGISSSIILYTALGSFSTILYLIFFSCLLILVVGVIDDYFELQAWKKALAQLTIVIVIILFGKVEINSMHGVFYIYALSDNVSIILTAFTMLLIINSFNLIDGIDGLAGILGLVIAIFFSIYFYLDTQIAFSLLSLSLAGSLLAFLYFNLSNSRIFMGDGGSMLLGLLLSILSIHFIECAPRSDVWVIKNSPAICIAFLAIPILDTLRVFFLRLMKGKSPFSPDRNHIHHLLEKIGLTHLQICLLLAGCTILLVAFIFFITPWLNITCSIILISLLYFLFVLFVFLRSQTKNRVLKN
jgi:UDP-GlcNAc:undecaprenyl-phosphate GlcNAc-1-phosphate transferase